MIPMAEAKKNCMICGKAAPILKGGICEPCQERIRREALGEQAGIGERDFFPISATGGSRFPASKRIFCPPVYSVILRYGIKCSYRLP